MLAGWLNGDLTGVKLVNGAGRRAHIAFLVLNTVPAVAGGCCANGIRKGLELEEPDSDEEILPFVGRCGGTGSIDVRCRAGAGNGPALAWPSQGLPHHREEESGVAARSSQSFCLQSEALPLVVGLA